MNLQFWVAFLHSVLVLSWFVVVSAVVLAAFSVKTALGLFIENNREVQETRRVLEELQGLVPSMRAREQELDQLLVMLRSKERLLTYFVNFVQKESLNVRTDSQQGESQ